MTEAQKRLQNAEAILERDKHGKDAFLGSSAWGYYVAAREALEAARAAVAAERS